MDDHYTTALDRLIRPIAAGRLPDDTEPMQALLAALDHPERAMPVVVVAGSTGKGTTALRLASALAAGGLRVGLYTSPHLHSFRERFAILDGNPVLTLIPPEAFVAHAGAVDAASAALGYGPSTFESATALAFRWFAAEAVDIAVCEIGLGGRFDAVNAAPNVLALIGPIEREHAAMLGGTLESIAWHKAGVIALGGRAITVPQLPSVFAVLEAEADRQKATLTVAVDLAVAGLTVLQEIGLAPPRAAIPNSVALPGRLERVTIGGRQVLIDGGHTPLAARRLANTIVPDLAGGVRIIVGMLADKDTAAYLAPLDVPGITLVLTTAPSERAQSPQALRAAFEPRHAMVEEEPSFVAAMEAGLMGPGSLLVITGSLRMAAAAREALGLLTESELEESRRTRALFEGPGYRARWQS